MGAGAAMRRGPARASAAAFLCAPHRLRRSGKVQGPPKPETAATSPLGVVCLVPALTATSSDVRGQYTSLAILEQISKRFILNDPVRL